MRLYVTFSQTQDQCSESMTPLLTPFILEGIDVIENSQGEDSLLLGMEYIDFEELGLEAHYRAGSAKEKMSSRNVHSKNRQPHHYLIFDNELEMILADNEDDYEISEEQYFEHAHESSFESNFESQSLQGNCEESLNQENSSVEKQGEEKIELANLQNLPCQWLRPNPKKKLIEHLQLIASEKKEANSAQILAQIKQVLSPFIFDHERFYIQESIDQLKGSASEIIEILIRGVSQNFKKNVRGLTFEKRRIKLFKYMEKKRRRIWKKKVNYDCRKKVADGRLRIKGKFVTYEQACREIGCKKEETSTDEVKCILEKNKSQTIS